MEKLKSSFKEFNPLLLVVVSLLVAYLFWNTTKVVQKNHGLQQQVDDLSEEISLLELENENLKLNNEYYRTDSYLELEARKKFNKVAKGESHVVLPKHDYPDENKQSQATLDSDKSQVQANFDQWMYFLFNVEP